MNETKSQTPETDKKADECCPHELGQHQIVPADFARSLEISRDQWKAVAESLKDALIQCRYRLGDEDASVADYDQFDAALTEFNQLNSTTENK